MRATVLAAAAAAIAAFAAAPLAAGPDTVRLPDGYAGTFVNYLDVDRPDRKRVRRMYVSPEAHAAAAAGQALPDGTVLIMEDHDAMTDAAGQPVYDANGRMVPQDAATGIFVMEKNAGWTTANGNWDYAWYLPDGSPRPDASFDGCFSCHASREARDYTFTYWKFVFDRSR